MKEQTLIVLGVGSSLIPTQWIVIAILALAVVIIGFAVYVRRGKNKNVANDSVGNDWQPQQQQQDAWNQQGSAAGWNQQQQQNWNAPAQQQQQSWGGQGAPQQSWGGNPAQPQSQANPWSNPGSAPNAQQWGSSPAQPGANPWAAQQQPPVPPAANPWAQQGQQAPPSQTQPGGGQWGNQGAAQNPWEAAPAAAPAVQQDPWAAQQQQQPWNSAPAGSSPMQPQQGPNSLGGTPISGQGWGQPAQQPQDPWAAQQQQPQDPWAAQQQQQQGQYGNAAAPGAPNNAWQQSQPGYGQGYGAPAADPNAAYPDSDKTMLRGAPQQPYAGNIPNANSIGYVRVEEGKEPGRVYEIRKESLSIGRSRESDIFLEDLAVSRLHASVVNMGNGNYALKDEGSANGTKVNGQLVNKFQTYPLQDGDRIQLGQTVLVFGRK